MDKDEFCYSMGEELTSWKNRISDELKKIERMDSGAKQKMLPIVEDFMMLETEMNSRINQFKNECSPDFVPPREGSEFKPDFNFNVDDVDDLGGPGSGNIGG